MNRNHRTILGGAVLLLAVCSAAASAEPLRIAVTNDDGWNAAGIRALHAAFRRDGHTVTLVGPLSQQSGSSAAINTSGVTVRRQSERVYSAAISDSEGSEPLVAGMLAIELATALDGAPPHWLVSGINQGANLGNATQHSGTVGAAIGALGGSFGAPVPAIAVSTDEPRCDPDCVERHYADVAAFVARLLATLKAPLPAGAGLNINYPPLPADAIKGVRVVRQGNGFPVGGKLLRMQFSCETCAQLQDGETAPVRLSPVPDTTPPTLNSDTAAFSEGYITIVPIEGDHTANDFEGLKSRLAPVATLER